MAARCITWLGYHPDRRNGDGIAVKSHGRITIAPAS